MSLDDNDEILNTPWDEVADREFEETPEQIIERNIKIAKKRKTREQKQKDEMKKYHPRARDEKQNITVIPFDPNNSEALQRGNYISVVTSVEKNKDGMILSEKRSVGRIIRKEPTRIQVDFNQQPDADVSQALSGTYTYKIQ